MRLKAQFDKYEAQTTMMLCDHEDRLNSLSSVIVSANIRSTQDGALPLFTHRGPGALPTPAPSQSKSEPIAALFDWKEMEDMEVAKATSISLGVETYLGGEPAPTSPRRGAVVEALTPAASVVINHEHEDVREHSTTNTPAYTSSSITGMLDTIAQIDT